MSSRELAPGIAAVHQFEVTDADTAERLGSGDVRVLGTPALLAWMEAVTVDAIRSHLAPEQTSVGWKVSLEHLRPSFVGATITIEARVEAVDGSRVTFAVVARDEDADIGRADVVRVVTSRDRFAR